MNKTEEYRRITINNHRTGAVIYSHERAGNTMQRTVNAALEDSVCLDSAYIAGPVKLVGCKIKDAIIKEALIEHCEIISSNVNESLITDSIIVSSRVTETGIVRCKTSLNEFKNCLLDETFEIIRVVC